MEFIDTHAHLYAEEFQDDTDVVIARALSNGIGKMLLPDIDAANRPAMISLHKNYPKVCPMMLGLHPTSVNENYRAELDALEEALSKYECCGIGETGMDMYWDKTFVKQQEDAFTWQVELALQKDLPLVIHSRKSLNEIFGILRKHSSKPLRGVFHCFPGSVEEAKRAVGLGFMLGIGGVVTYKNAGMAEVVRQIPLQHIVLETDAPYLPPVPYRGKRNESSYIPVIAEFIAGIKNCSPGEVAAITTANALDLFKLSGHEE